MSFSRRLAFEKQRRWLERQIDVLSEVRPLKSNLRSGSSDLAFAEGLSCHSLQNAGQHPYFSPDDQ